MKKILSIFLYAFTISCLFTSSIKADTSFYYVYDCGSDDKQVFNSYIDAYEYWYKQKDNYLNLCLSCEDKVLNMEYGVVIFKDEIVEYYSEERDCFDYFDGNYAADGAFLYATSSKAYFKLSGDTGSISIDEIRLVPYGLLKQDVSLYETKNNHLYHSIRNTMGFDYYAYYIDLGIKPESLKDDSKYYSYDGHYFYENFYLMIDDYNKGKYDNAINETPIYNYYQYLSSHSLSSINKENLEDYFYNTLNINSKLDEYRDLNNDGINDCLNKSMLYKTIGSFIDYQNKYGVNALCTLSSSIVDSQFGKSLNSYTHNSLFANLVFDNDYERDNQRYLNAIKSIETHNKYFVNKLYSDMDNSKYAGTYLGNKLSGITIEYSLDPYYGEKCASAYMMIDSYLNNQDLNKYCIGVVLDKNITFYNDELLENKEFSLNTNELVLIILSETENSYLVQIDECEKNLSYDFSNSRMYVEKDVFDYVFNKQNIDNIIDLDIEYSEEELINENYELKINDEQISFADIREDDLKNLTNTIYGYHIGDNDLDISVSGLTSALKNPLFNLIFGDTYYVQINENANVSNKVTNMINAYGYEVVNCIDLSFKLNYSNKELQSPIIVQSKINHEDFVGYSVYHIQNNGDIVKCKSEWSDNYVRFICEESGKYLITKKQINNNFHFEDKYENINQYNNSVDNHKFIREVFAFLVFMTLNLIGFVVYFIFTDYEEKLWKDYRRSLLTAAYVPEEKLKN